MFLEIVAKSCPAQPFGVTALCNPVMTETHCQTLNGRHLTLLNQQFCVNCIGTHLLISLGRARMLSLATPDMLKLATRARAAQRTTNSMCIRQQC